jgi:hypothetical protein
MRRIVSLAVAVLTCGCGGSPVAPDAPPRLSVPPPLNLTGTWTGRGSDSQGAHIITLTLAQTGDSVSGRAITRAVDPADGTCASCYKNKDGRFSGIVSDTALTLKMLFPTGGDVPTPICSVTIDATASGITSGRIAATYSGEDSCEGPFTDGSFTIDRAP